MSFKYIKRIPKADEIVAGLPLSRDLAGVKGERDKEIIAVFEQKSPRFILIIGPCSAHDEDAVCEYVSRLARLQEEVKERLILIPRIYTNKPRTTGKGYKGMVHQPDPKKKPNMVEGIKGIRKMHIRALKESHLTAADEMLYPMNYPYLEDILSYVAIGARSVENQQHRLTISGLDIPAGMKNPTSGNLEVMFNAIYAARLSHIFIYNGQEVATSGNQLCHCILRGATNHYGQDIPNYHYEDLIKVTEMYKKHGFSNPAIIVDTNHANSSKRYQEQKRIALEVMQSRSYSKTLRQMVKGLMIESFLVPGSQDVTGTVFGQSITDPCLGWDSSAKLVRQIAEYV